MKESGTGRSARANIYDVAARAGVSHMTVSRVLNGHPNISAATRERVERAIEETNYRPSSIARALATRRARRIGVIVDGPVEYGPNSTLREFEAAAHRQGYAVSAFSVADDEERTIDAGLVDLVSQGVDALCVIAPRSSSLDAVHEQQHSVPVLVIKPRHEDGEVTVGIDQYAGARLAVDHLLDLGHADVHHLAGPLDWLEARAREETWRERIATRGLRPRPPVIGNWTSDFGYAFGADPGALDGATAIFAANDQIALGVIHGLSSRGVRVPADVSVVGFDDLADARHFLPPLTTVRQDFAELGRVACDTLLGMLESGPVVSSTLLTPELVVRSSTASHRS